MVRAFSVWVRQSIQCLSLRARRIGFSWEIRWELPAQKLRSRGHFLIDVSGHRTLYKPPSKRDAGQVEHDGQADLSVTSTRGRPLAPTPFGAKRLSEGGVWLAD